MGGEWVKLSIKSNSFIVKVRMECDTMIRLHGMMFYFSFKHQVSYLMITEFLPSKRLIRDRKR